MKLSHVGLIGSVFAALTVFACAEDAAQTEPQGEEPSELRRRHRDGGITPPPDAGGGDATTPPPPPPPPTGGGGYPDATTTGPRLSACPGGALKKYTGDSVFRPTSGQVVECMEFKNVTVYIPSDISNVTIRNCRFVTTVDLFVNVQGPDVTIEDTAFVGPAETWIRNSYSGHHLTVRRSDFSGMGNAVEFNVGYEVMEDNYIHDFGNSSPDQHADGLQTDGTAHAVLRHNTVLLNDVAGMTGAISIFGTNDDILVENNRVAGGGYTIYPSSTGSTKIRFLNNCYSTIFYPGKAQTGLYGPWYPSNNPVDLVRTGNTWCDGPLAGQPLNH